MDIGIRTKYDDEILKKDDEQLKKVEV